MDKQTIVATLKRVKEWFDRTTACLEEEHSGFVPAEGMFSTAHQVVHVAQTVDWFIQGASRPEGFDMNFDALLEEMSGVTSLTEARARLDRSFQAAEDWVNSCSDEELAAPLPQGFVMGGLPRFSIVPAMEDHTAHHRGALTVYARLQGLTPAMPYM
jgi:uncharacterized damage-inducible protein DinB